jgi:hypothetical protein
MQTLNQVLETALQLPSDQQEMLIRILQNRHHETRRDRIAQEAQESLSEYRTGNLQPQSASEVIAQLRQSLQSEDA